MSNKPKPFSEIIWLSASANRERRDGGGWTEAIELGADSAIIRRIERRKEVSRRVVMFRGIDDPGISLEIVEPPPAFEPAPSIQAEAATALAAMDERPHRRKVRSVPRAPQKPPLRSSPRAALVVAIVIVLIVAAVLVAVLTGSL